MPLRYPLFAERLRRWPRTEGLLRVIALAVFALALALVLLLASWGVPQLLRWQITTRGSELLGRPVTVGKINFVPWRLETTVADLAVAQAPAGALLPPPPKSPGPLLQAGGAPTFQVARVRFRLAWASLWKFAPVVQDLVLQSPHLRVRRTSDGQYDVDDIVSRLSRPDPKPKPAAAFTAPRFSLRGARIEAGAIDFDDKGVQRQVRDLELTLPFIGTLDESQRDKGVQPRLAFSLDGSHFDSSADATPFAEVRKGELTLRVDGFDLAPWRSYLPASLPVRLAAGTLDADITLKWAGAESTVPSAGAPGDGTGIATAAPVPLDLRGHLRAHRLQLTDADGGALADVQRLDLDLAHLDPFGRTAEVSRLELTQPAVHIDREADGGIRGLATKPAAEPAVANAAARPPGAGRSGASKSTASAPATATAPAPAQAPKAAASGKPDPGWRVRLGAVAVRDGRVELTDKASGTTTPAISGSHPDIARLRISGLTLDAGPVAYPLLARVPFRISADLDAGSRQTHGGGPPVGGEASTAGAGTPSAEPPTTSAATKAAAGAATAGIATAPDDDAQPPGKATPADSAGSPRSDLWRRYRSTPHGPCRSAWRGACCKWHGAAFRCPAAAGSWPAHIWGGSCGHPSLALSMRSCLRTGRQMDGAPGFLRSASHSFAWPKTARP